MQMNYINNQTSLKLELDWIPKKDHIVWAIVCPFEASRTQK
ncbi:hypothetical protein [Companilactobacillus sp. HBUAS59544]